MPDLTPQSFGECAQVSRDAPGALPGASADQEAVAGAAAARPRDQQCRGSNFGNGGHREAVWMDVQNHDPGLFAQTTTVIG